VYTQEKHGAFFKVERGNIVLPKKTLEQILYVGLIEHLPWGTLENGIQRPTSPFVIPHSLAILSREGSFLTFCVKPPLNGSFILLATKVA
jgi:hypothetical protein